MTKLNKKIFIHMGYPKCLSTSLQRFFFSKHDEINYFGVGSDTGIDYATTEIEYIFEILMKYSRNDVFDYHLASMRKHIADVYRPSKVNLVSSEHLLMNFTLQGIDPEQKIDRLTRLFKDYEIEVIVIERDKSALIKSLYNEYIKMGYYESFETFERWVVSFADRNFLYDLDYHRKKQLLSRNFRKIHWLKFETLINGDTSANINKKFTKILNIRNLNLNIGKANESLTDDQVEALRCINEKHRREMGSQINEAFEHHRNRSLFEFHDFDISEEEIYQNVILKRQAYNLLFDELDK